MTDLIKMIDDYAELCEWTGARPGEQPEGQKERERTAIVDRINTLVGDAVEAQLWLSAPQENLRRFCDTTSDAERLSMTVITVGIDMSGSWALMGTALVFPTFLPYADHVRNAVNSIDHEITRIRANAEHQINRLRDARSKLLAITHKEGA